MDSKFKKGDIVKLVNTDKKGMVFEEPKIISDQYYYDIFIDNTHKTYSEESLEPAEIKKVNLKRLFSKNEFSAIRDFNSYMTFIKVERPLSNNLYAFLSSRTVFEVHQFKPVVKYLNSPYQRLLVADEVGVGKTIEAGVIYTELRSRHELKNSLIICPSALRYKWQKEMKKRFNEDFGLIDTRTLKAFFKRYDRTPYGVGIKGIASIQMLRNEEILKELERLQIPFDFIVVDEAHHMRNETTRSYQLGKILSESAEGMVFLSATPLQLGNKDLFNLFHILLPDEFDNLSTFEEQVKPNEFINLALREISKKESAKEILEMLRNVENTSQKDRFLQNQNYNFCVNLLSNKDELEHIDRVALHTKLNELNVLSQIYTRTKKKEINIKAPIREPTTISVDFTEDEATFYNKVSQLFLRLHPGAHPGFILQMPQRQVASCIPAAKKYLKDLYRAGEIDLSKEDIDVEEEEEGKLILTERDLTDIKSIIEFAETIKDPDSKTVKFLEAIQNMFSKGDIKKVIIFSFFKRTLKYLEKQLKDIGISVARVDGDVPFIEREQIIEKFAEPDGYQVLLSSEVGGEGLDMQFCNCMINYDLPWNPMRIEQRIGRLDRYGQESPKVYIYNFSVEGTIESNIFLRLCNRIGVFEQYVGELEPILGEQIKQLTQELGNPKLTPEQQKEKADQAALVIERKKKELELFDVERNKFIGQDDYFTEQITDIQKNERFITHEEVLNLVNNFINEEYPKSKIEASKDKNGIYNLKVDHDLRGFVLDCLKTQKISTETEDLFINQLHKDLFSVTFDYEVANANSHIEFITIRHPFVKAIISHYEKKEFKPITKISYKDTNLDSDSNYLFFIYLLEIKSFTKSLTFVPVVLKQENGEIDDELSKRLLKIIKESEDYSEDVSLSEDDIINYEDVALEHMTKTKREKEIELKETNESLINDRLSSMEQTHNLRITKIDEFINRLKQNEDEKSQKVINMKESQKINLNRNYDQKKAQLEADKKIIVSHELIAGGFLNVKQK